MGRLGGGDTGMGKGGGVGMFGIAGGAPKCCTGWDGGATCCTGGTCGNGGAEGICGGTCGMLMNGLGCG